MRYNALRKQKKFYQTCVNDTIMHCRAMAGYSYLSTYRLMYSVYPKLHQNGLLIVQLTI